MIKEVGSSAEKKGINRVPNHIMMMDANACGLYSYVRQCECECVFVWMVLAAARPIDKKVLNSSTTHGE